MNIINKSAFHISIGFPANTAIDTEITIVPNYPPAKYLVTYFEGGGTLEVSQDGNVWIDTAIGSGALIPIATTLPRYIRITGSGDKIAHLTSI